MSNPTTKATQGTNRFIYVAVDTPVTRRQGDAVQRYIEIYSIMMRNSLIREMSFKANFLLWMVVEILWFCGQIVFFSIIFGNVDRIGDWTKWEVVLLIGTHQIIAQLFQAFFFVNVANIPELVRTGKLDSVLVLPIDSQFAVSTKQFGLDSIVNALLGAAVVVFSLSKLGVVPDPLSILLYVIARDPDVIFPWLFRLIFGWLIPVVIIANIPARLLIKSLGQPFPLILQLIIASSIVFWLSRVFWKFALGHYSSASS